MELVLEGPPIGFVVDVVNGWASVVCHDVPGPGGRTFPERTDLVERWGVALPAVDDLTISRWADQAYGVFAGAADARALAANRLLGTVDLQPHLSPEGLRWRCRDAELVVGALLAAGLVRYAIEDDAGLAMLGTCDGVRCRDAYVDRSQGRTRRYCSTRCQNRTKTYRRRGRT